MIESSQKALLHVYPDLAGLAELERRQLLERAAGVVSSSDPRLDQEGFERAMASYEAVLWDRVERKVVADPRACRKCGRPMRMVQAGFGECPEGCGRRKVYAWHPRHWRNKLPQGHGANSRQIWKLRQVWGLLKDFLPEEQRTEDYLAAMIATATGQSLQVHGAFPWHTLTSRQCHLAIEACKDRLSYAVR